ncbi:hypothetical protein [Actinomycetospora flava]|uniref:Uncharacterized protein n=1 Tax=Actinomycetospora flava TaxID=3129232 RepID=A0ABU8MCW4_9PSEU
MSTDAATPETPVPPEPDGATDGPAVDGPAPDGPGDSGPDGPDETATESSAPAEAGAEAGSEAGSEVGAEDEAEEPADPAPAEDPPVVAHVPAPAEPVHDTTRAPVTSAAAAPTASSPGPVSDDAGGRLTARLREARARLQPAETVIPAPRTPEGVVPPVPFQRGSGPPPADLLRTVDALAARLAELEDDDGRTPERRALLRALDRSAAGVPDGGWSGEDRVDAEALADAAELAAALHAAAASLLERLDAEERTGSAVEVDAVATALQVARMVIDLEAFARHGR